MFKCEKCIVLCDAKTCSLLPSFIRYLSVALKYGFVKARVMPLTPIYQKKRILLVEVVSQMNAKQTWWLLQLGNTFTFHTQIATLVQKDFPFCRRCFAELVLVGK